MLIWPVALIAALASSCAHVKVDPIEVKPIYIRADINIIDKQLDDFFAFQDKAAATQPATTTQSTTPTAGAGVQGATP
jgi:hypothetical protein